MNKSIDLSLVVVSDDVVSCDLDGEAAILNIESGIYFGLDPIGAKIWNSIKTPCLFSDLVQLVINEYEVEEERCKTDISEFIHDLMDKGLVKINGSN